MSKLLLIGVIAALVAGVLAVGYFSLSGDDSVTGAVTGTEPEVADEAEETEEAEEPAAAPGNLADIKEGMSKSQVLEIGGEPLEKQTTKTAKGSTVEYWYYESGDDVYQVAFDSTNTVSVVRIY
jgi:outer membrane protein assembly factor BamE (lipoprotein component of BamABCDE complex)